MQFPLFFRMELADYFIGEQKWSLINFVLRCCICKHCCIIIKGAYHCCLCLVFYSTLKTWLQCVCNGTQSTGMRPIIYVLSLAYNRHVPSVLLCNATLGLWCESMHFNNLFVFIFQYLKFSFRCFNLSEWHKVHRLIKLCN